MTKPAHDPRPQMRKDARVLAAQAKVAFPDLRTRLATLRMVHSQLVLARQDPATPFAMRGDHRRWAGVYRLVIADVLVAMREVEMRPKHTAPHPAIA